MIPGFVPISTHQFYCDIWPRIRKRVEAIHSTAEAYRAHGVLPLLIYWGYRGETRDENIIIAVSRSDAGQADEYWIDPDLIATQH